MPKRAVSMSLRCLQLLGFENAEDEPHWNHCEVDGKCWMNGISLGYVWLDLDGNGFMSHLKDLSDDDGIDGIDGELPNKGRDL